MIVAYSRVGGETPRHQGGLLPEECAAVDREPTYGGVVASAYISPSWHDGRLS
jgi:hypothetical protein